MKKRTIIFALLVLVLPMVLAACGGGLDEDEFADAVEKAFEDGDFGDYNDLVCEDDQIDEDQEASEADVSVECSVEDDTVECDVEGEGDTLTLRGDVDDDDKACTVMVGEGDEAIRLVDLIALTAGEGEDLPDVEPTEETTEGDDTEAEPTEETEAEPTEETEAEPTEEG